MKRRISRLAATLLAAALLAGCGASGGSTNSSAATYEMSSDAAMAQEAGGAESALLPEGTNATTETAQKMIYRANLSLESTDFDTARDTLLAAVDANDAWLEYSHLSGSADDHDRRASYTVRVPADNYSTFLAQAGESGNLLNLEENAENVTSDYIDLQARIDSLENQRDRLNELAAGAETTADLLEIESQLSDVQYQLESYTQQMRALSGQITYSTVDISLREVASLTPSGTTFPERLTDAFRGGWNGFVLCVQGIVLVVVYLWPLLIIAVLAVIVIRVLARRHRARHPRPSKPTAPSSSPASYGAPPTSSEPPADDTKPKY
ncbi:DUF4349 domain-containing protein [Subdoligranulum variabile]|uniref:DUF4349 domain-containing protein n=1 Tax=Subdoligranulum variabile DSM 15176 TaxID=411471 RepID=D1PJL3_9FIRM|nr:DUF4349 domain-containing protein [Subdoligranulum variabile]EFB76961.1 hypothetical protein SUBVAR_04583 [Subdoligranulum variabile DSM 15176]UWP67631.1 DUF4349 domain-containing protein [Subdoligranulum variabile]